MKVWHVQSFVSRLIWINQMLLVGKKFFKDPIAMKKLKVEEICNHSPLSFAKKFQNSKFWNKPWYFFCYLSLWCNKNLLSIYKHHLSRCKHRGSITSLLKSKTIWYFSVHNFTEWLKCLISQVLTIKIQLNVGKREVLEIRILFRK